MKVNLNVVADHNSKTARIISDIKIPKRCLEKVREKLRSINERTDYMVASYNPDGCTVFITYERRPDESVQDIVQATIWVFRACAEIISAYPELNETVEVEL